MNGLGLLSNTVYFFVTFMIHQKVYNVQPEPYLDEVFHVPQNQRYCALNSSVSYILSFWHSVTKSIGGGPVDFTPGAAAPNLKL